MVVSLLVLQGFLGYYHHYRYEKDKPTERRWFTYLHIVGGLILVFLGLLNCGSGLTMARVPSVYVTVAWALSGILAVLYIVAVVVQSLLKQRRARRPRPQST